MDLEQSSFKKVIIKTLITPAPAGLGTAFFYILNASFF